MDKIFYKNQYIKEFKSKVIEVKIKDNKYHIVLDKTAFFPGGGGQQYDFGEIDGKVIENIYEENKKIYHVLSEEVKVEETVYCTIDWDRREDGMHQHLGQHILSGCFFKLFNANTVSIHLGKEISTVDIIGHLSENQVREAEALANEVIRNNITVEFLTPNKEELEILNLRRDLPNTDEEIRVVKIGDLDINACCGVHPSKTLDLRMIKIKKFEKNKGNTRIEFLAGKRAIEDSLNKDKILREICNYLSSNEDEIFNGIKNMQSELEALKITKKKIEDELLNYEYLKILEEIKLESSTVIKKVFKDKPKNYLGKLANKLVEENNIVCLFANILDGKAEVIFASSKSNDDLDMGKLLKEHIAKINGKGGGRKNFAQGVGDNINVEEFLNNIYFSISNLYL